MKKLFVALFALILTLSVTVTGYAATDAYELYTTMNDAVGRAQSLEAEMTMDVTVTMGELNLPFFVKATVRELMKSETDIEMEMAMDMRFPSALGMPSTSVYAYYVDGYMYQEQMGERYKMKMDLSEAMQQASVDMLDISFTREDFADITASAVDGGTEIRFTLSGDTMNKMLDSVLQSQVATLGMTDFDVVISDIDNVILVGDNNLPIRQSMNMSLEMATGGETMKMTMDMVMEYKGFNTFWAILYPDWLGNCLEY